jgi:hypothetical protein
MKRNGGSTCSGIYNSRSSDPSYSTAQYSSLARFGIGFWSVFTISEKAIIATAPFEYQNREAQNGKVKGVQFEVSIKEFKDFTVFGAKEMDAGTSIKLSLKNSVNILDILYRITYHIGSSLIPINIHDDKGNVIPISEKMHLPSMEMVFGAKIGMAKQFNLTEFVYYSVINEIDIQIKMYYTRNSEGLQFSLPSNPNQHSFLSLQDRSIHMKFRGSGICGFLFNSIPGTVLLDLSRVGYMVANALNPKGYKFTINRMGLLDSPEYTRYKEIVAREIHNCYRKFLVENNSLDAKTISRLNQQSRLHGGETHGSFTGSQLKKLLIENEDLIAFKLYKIDKNRTLDNCEVIYIFYSNLIKQTYLLWLFNPPYYASGANAEHQQKQTAYNFLKIRPDLTDSSYMLERTREADMIADNATNGIIDARTIMGSSYTPFIFRKFFSNDIDANSGETFEIAFIRGAWAGSITERPIDGANFVKLYQNHFIVKPNSLIAKDIRKLISDGMVFQAAELIQRLTDVVEGQPDPIFIKYFLDNDYGTPDLGVFITVG